MASESNISVDAIRQAAEHGEHVTPERGDAGITELRTVGVAAIVASALRLLG